MSFANQKRADRAKLKQAREFKDNVLRVFIWLAAALTVGFLFWIIWYILSNGLRHVPNMPKWAVNW